MSKYRRQSHEIEIDVPKEEVWKAIAEAEGLKQWYVEDARVEPGEGGEQWISWGGGMEVATKHLVWKPNEKVAVGDPNRDESQPGWNTLVIEMSLEDLGNSRTLLRLVQSGIPDDADWDSSYEGTDAGWTTFLATLKYYLEHQRGKSRRTLFRYAGTKRSPEQIWSLLLGPEFLNVSAHGSGSRFEARTAAGDTFSGTILRERTHRVFLASIDELDGLVAIANHPTKEGGTFVNFILSAYGDKAERLAALRDRWNNLLDRTFPAE